MDTSILHDCLFAALDGRLPFPESVKRMTAAGVERYRADLVRLEKLHYAADGETHLERIPLDRAPAVAAEFSESEVKSAVVDIQHARIQYPEFLRRIMRAGVTDYTVSIVGRRAAYSGRSGDFYVERFPERPASPRES